jgi:hypothetical protein
LGQDLAEGRRRLAATSGRPSRGQGVGAPSRYRRRMRLTVWGLHPTSWALSTLEWPPADNRRMEQLRNTWAEPVVWRQ